MEVNIRLEPFAYMEDEQRKAFHELIMKKLTEVKVCLKESIEKGKVDVEALLHINTFHEE